ncbi:DUF5719 family protein [Gulosibacter molinativorax]|nr:DUF5719 family protein [Gulosibacter molinativorax]
MHDADRGDVEPKEPFAGSVDRELLAPPEADPYAVPRASADAQPADDASPVHPDDTVPVLPEGEVPIDENAPSTTAAAAKTTSAGGSTMARRVRKARRKRRGQKAVARRRSVVGAVTHTIGAISALAIIGASTWALGWYQLPSFSAQAEPIEIAPAPGDQQRVCPGSLQQLGLADDADAASPVGTAEVTIASSYADYSTQELGGEPTDPVSIEAPGQVGDAITMLSASQSVFLSTNATTGLSVTNCTQPIATQWLLGGATTLGHTLVLDVINPGTAEARVNFEVYGTDGAIVPGLQEVVVQPGERETMSLAGVAPSATAFAVKVTSTGSAVSAFLHETIIDTLTPKGSDIVGSTALPSTTQTLPGLHVYARPDADATSFTEIGTTLRILNPNEEDTTATLTAYAADGSVAYSGELELTSMRIVELPFADVAEGDYTIRLDADRPVLLSGRVSPLDRNEFAWVPSSSTLVGDEIVPVAEGPNPRLAVYNPTEEAREVEVDGSTVTIEPLATYETDVSAASTVELHGVAGLTAAVHYSAGGQLASAPVRPGNADAEAIRVVK